MGRVCFCGSPSEGRLCRGARADPPEEQCSDDEHGDGEPLAAREEEDACGLQVCIGEADELGRDASERVCDDEDGGDDSGLAGRARDPPDHDADQDSLRGGLVELGGVACGEEYLKECAGFGVGAVERGDGAVDWRPRVGGVGGEREAVEQRVPGGVLLIVPEGLDFAESFLEFGGVADGPCRCGLSGRCDDASEEFGVDEVGDASEEDAEGRDESDAVEDMEGRRFGLTRDPEGGDGEPDHPAVGCHAALGEVEETPEREVRGEVDDQVGSVEECVADSSAGDGADDDGDEGIGDLLGGEKDESAFGEDVEDDPGDGESHEVGEAVPPDGDGAVDGYGDGVEVVEVCGERVDHGWMVV